MAQESLTILRNCLIKFQTGPKMNPYVVCATQSDPNPITTCTTDPEPRLWAWLGYAGL